MGVDAGAVFIDGLIEDGDANRGVRAWPCLKTCISRARIALKSWARISLCSPPSHRRHTPLADFVVRGLVSGSRPRIMPSLMFIAS